MTWFTRASHLAAFLAVVSVLCAAAIPGCGGDRGSEPAPGESSDKANSADGSSTDGPVTFCKDIAPIVFENCSTCHRPGESAPFSLLTYDDVTSHAQQIVDVTKNRFMPPWLPEPGHHKFVGDRHLTDHQIDLFRRWVDGGEREGDVADLPPLPKWPEGWQLGEPDMIITMPETYELPADGTDVFRNFVIPIPVTQTRYVRAVELRPGNKRIVHHASMFVDRTRSARRLDARDPGPGFAGMEVGDAEYPDGHFLGWTPGRSPDAGVEGISWRLDPGSDLVLQLHMLPGGKPEPIRSSIGLFFDGPPQTTARAHTILLKADEALNIPPGANNFVVGDAFTLPIDTQAILIYPHAHYLGKQIHAFAAMPAGQLQPLIRIDDWDFNWQDSYRYVKPVQLPKGSVITMRWAFDNSAENVRNPSNPPVPVTYGNRSTDEMAHLYVQLLVRNQREADLLREATYAHRVQKFPLDAPSHTQLGRAREALGNVTAAVASYQRALRLDPDNSVAHQSLALVLEAQGEYETAAAHFSRALEQEPGDVRIHVRLAQVLQRDGRLAEAIARYKLALEVDAKYHAALNNLAWLLATTPDDQLRAPAEAVDLAKRASDLLGNQDASTLDTLAAAYASAGEYELAKKTAREGLELATKLGNRAMMREIQSHLQRYERGEPLWMPEKDPDAAGPK